MWDYNKYYKFYLITLPRFNLLMEAKAVKPDEVKFLAEALELEELELYRNALSTGFIGYQKAVLAMY